MPKDKSIQDMTLPNKEYEALNAQAANYRTILRVLKMAGFDDFLVEEKRAPIDLLTNPSDTSGGESACLFIKSIAEEASRIDIRNHDLSASLVDTTIALTKEKRKNPSFGKRTWWQQIIDFFVISPDTV